MKISPIALIHSKILCALLTKQRHIHNIQKQKRTKTCFQSTFQKKFIRLDRSCVFFSSKLYIFIYLSTMAFLLDTAISERFKNSPSGKKHLLVDIILKTTRFLCLTSFNCGLFYLDYFFSLIHLLNFQHTSGFPP